MAWISVHQEVLGGKLRSLSKMLRCSQNEALGILVRLWLWSLNNADRRGKIISAGADDIAYELGIGLEESLDADNVVSALEKTGWLDIEEDAIWIHDWEQWQKYWISYIENKKKNADRQRKFRESKSSSEKKKVAVTEKVTVVKASPPKEPEKFNLFWEAYPRKEGKGKAVEKYIARLKAGWSADDLIKAAGNYARKMISERRDKKYILLPQTFLSHTEPFTDYLPKKGGDHQEDDSNPYKEWS